jgi:hypothetical protein
MTMKYRFMVVSIYVLLAVCTTAVLATKVEQSRISPQIGYGEPVDFCLDISGKEIPKVYAVITYPDGGENKYILEYVDFSSKSGVVTAEGYCFKELRGYEFRYQGFTPKGTGTYLVTFVINDGIEESKFDSSFEVKEKKVDVGTVDVCKTVENVKSVESVKSIDLPTLTMHGTEYQVGENAKVWLQLLSGTMQTINNATCFTDIYYPNGMQFRERQIMNFLEDGVYYYDFIVPTSIGVYPSIGICYYTTETFSNAATAGAVTIGVDGAGDFSTTETENGYRWRVDEALSGGAQRIDFNMTFGGVMQPSLGLDLVVVFEGKWNGGADYLTVSILNQTSKKWIALPNTIPDTGGVDQYISNSITGSVGTNYTSLGYISPTGTVNIMFNDTSLADATTSNIQTDYVSVQLISLGGPEWHEVRGSSELHVSSLKGYLFGATTLCGDEEVGCGVFADSYGNFSDPEGVVIENITFTNLVGGAFTSQYNFFTAVGLDCTGILDLKEHRGTETINILGDAIFNLGQKENCDIKIPVDFNQTETEYVVEVVMDNYPKWELLWAYDIVYLFNDTIMNICDDISLQYNYTFTIPIESLIAHDNTDQNQYIIGCQRAMDDLYYFYQNFEDSRVVTTIGELESYLAESRFYWPIIYDEYDAITTLQRNQNQIATLLLVNETPRLVWQHEYRNLTYIPPATVDLDAVSSAVWNYTNRTLTQTITATVDTDAIASAVWNYTIRNLTWWPSFITPSDIWTYSIRNLTYYPDTTNAETVWNYTARYIHGEII